MAGSYRRKPKFRSKAPKDKAPAKKPRGLRHESAALCVLSGAIFLCLALISGAGADAAEHGNLLGPIGAALSGNLFEFFGYCSFVIVFAALLIARSIWTGQLLKVGSRALSLVIHALAFCVMLVSMSLIAATFSGVNGGGQVGAELAYKAIAYVGRAGAVLFGMLGFLISLGVSTGVSSTDLLRLSVHLGRFGRRILVDSLIVLRGLVVLVVSGLAVLFGSIGRFLSWGFQVFARFFLYAVEEMREGLRGGEVEEGDELPLEGQSAFVLGEGDGVRRQKLKKKQKVRARYEDTDLDKDFAGGEISISRLKKAEPLKAEKAARLERMANGFKLPSLDLLTPGQKKVRSAPNDAELLDNSRRLEQALKDFKIGGRIVQVDPGPVITLYQFQPAAGVKVQRVINLADDLALALKVASVRVFAPVPGKGTVGIEVPNADRETVMLRDVLGSTEYQSADASLTLALGKNIFGEPYVADLSRMPHLLIAGATGTGKSVCINGILASLLYRNTPDDLRLILIDPKMLELSIYEDIPHLKAPVVVDPKRARGVLWWAVEEMERRYRLMRELGVRGLAGYNDAVDDMKTEAEAQEKLDSVEADQLPELNGPSIDDLPEKLPRIVIVVDELADLMLTVGREIEELLTRLAQKARAAGIHLILATQRPSVNVITGLIKANFPARISFQVASRIDARTVMDTSGAEKLLGQGDMLFLPPGTGVVKRLHSPFVSDKEVQMIVESLRKQGKPVYDAAIEQMIERLQQSENSNNGPGGDEEYDALYDQAVSLIIEKGQASTSMVQRAFRIGYNRAARILETMEREGLVGPADGARPREVLVPHAPR